MSLARPRPGEPPPNLSVPGTLTLCSAAATAMPPGRAPARRAAAEPLGPRHPDTVLALRNSHVPEPRAGWGRRPEPLGARHPDTVFALRNSHVPGPGAGSARRPEPLG